MEHARGYRAVPDTELVGVAEAMNERREKAVKELGCAGYATVAEMLDKAKPDIVSIVTQPMQRCELTLQCAAANSVKAITAEKPMAMNIAEADQMLAACVKANIILTVSQQMRFCPEFVSVQEAIARGDIGKVEFLRGVSYGNLMNQGTHVLDMIRWFAGEPRIEWVQSSWAEPEGYRDVGSPAPMWMICYIAFEGGIRACMENGLLYQKAGGVFYHDWLQKRVAAIGSEGFAEARVAGYGKVLSAGKSGWQMTPADNKTWDAATPAYIRELVECIRTGKLHRNHGRESTQTFEGMMALAQASVDGGIVKLPISRMRDPLAELNAKRPAPMALAR